MLNLTSGPPTLLVLPLLVVGCGGHTAPAQRAASQPTSAAPASAASTSAASESAPAPLDVRAASASGTPAIASPPVRAPLAESDDEPALDCTSPMALVDRLGAALSTSDVPGPPRPWTAEPITTAIDGVAFYRWVSGRCQARPVDGEVAISCGGRPHWVKGDQLERGKEWGVPLHRVGGKLLIATVGFHDPEPYSFSWDKEQFTHGDFVFVDAKGGWFFQSEGEKLGELQARSFGAPRVATAPVWPSDSLGCTMVESSSSAREYTLYVQCGEAREVRRLTWDGKVVTSARSSRAEVERAGHAPKALPDAAAPWAKELEQCADRLPLDDYGSTDAPRAPTIFMSGTDYWLNTIDGVYSTKKSRYTRGVTGVGHFSPPELELVPTPAGEGCPSQSARVVATTAARAARVVPRVLLGGGEMMPFARSELAIMNFDGGVWLMQRGQSGWSLGEDYYPYGHCIAPGYLRPVPAAWLKGLEFAEE